MLPLEIILTKRSSRNATAMYKGGRGSAGGGNRNYFNAIKIPQMVLYWQRATGLFSQTEVEQTRFAQNTRFGLVCFLTSYQFSPCPSPRASLEHLARLAWRQPSAGMTAHKRNAERGLWLSTPEEWEGSQHRVRHLQSWMRRSGHFCLIRMF